MPLFSGRFVTLECDGCGSAETSYGRGMTQREFARLNRGAGWRKIRGKWYCPDCQKMELESEAVRAFNEGRGE
jgi:hypothetical protein